MGDMADYYNDFRQFKKEKKQNNCLKSLEILDRHRIEYKKLSDTHYRISDFDFWPSTGLFVDRKNAKRGRGVMNLLSKVKAV